MGNHVSSTVKVILLNGTVQEFQNPVTAAEVMLDHPQQVVVQLQLNHRPAPLPADKKLEANNVYLMLPMRRGKAAALTSEEWRRLLNSNNKLLRSRKLLPSMPIPVLAKMCVDDGQKQRIVVKQPEIMSQQGLPEYLTPQVSGNKGWKPCLDTIKERKLEQKLSHWLFRL